MLQRSEQPQFITLHIRHNIEVAHRLFLLPGKCQNIHGHSMQVTLSVQAWRDENGYGTDAFGNLIEFGTLKKLFRGYLDETWDHHLHLNQDDPWARSFDAGIFGGEHYNDPLTLPGLQTWPGDPSTENIAWWINEWVGTNLLPRMPVSIDIAETGTNGVSAP